MNLIRLTCAIGLGSLLTATALAQVDLDRHPNIRRVCLAMYIVSIPALLLALPVLVLGSLGHP